MSWRGVDAGGAPVGPARPSPAAALAAAPVPGWPVSVVSDGGGRLSFAAAIGPGGDAVAALLDAPAGVEIADCEVLGRWTPAGWVDLPVSVVALPAAAEASADVDRSWLAAVERRRDECRAAVLGAGRADALEAALHVALLVATAPVEAGAGADVRVASGARLWLMAGAVASALSGAQPDPFQPWGQLVAAGWWPVGPCGGRLVLGR